MKRYAPWMALCALIVVGQNGLAQPTEPSIQLLAKPKEDGMWLRWAPTNPTVWQLGNQYGYMVERFTLKPNGELENPLGEKITSVPLRVYQPSELDKLSTTVKEAGIIKELVYGKSAAMGFQSNDPSSVLSRNKEMENLFGVALLVCDMSNQVAEAAGLFIKDRSVKKGVKYIYRVSIPYQNKKLSIGPGILVADFSEGKKLTPPSGLSAKFDDRRVTLSWSTLLDRGIYSAYHVEKSEDGKSFTRLTPIPYVHMSTSLQSESAFFVDSLQQNAKTYHYRIVGLTPFGETGPSTPTVSGEGKADLSGLLVIREGKVGTDRKVTLRWEFPQGLADQVDHFVVLKSTDPSKPFDEANKAIVLADEREFMDGLAFNNTYYIVVAIEKDGGERTRSFPFLVQMEDITPPVSPLGLSGAISKSGAATLTWSANAENDLKGYRVFRANKPTDEFIEVTKSIITGPTYIDSVNLHVLNKKIYYKVAAVDKSFNVSDYTAHLELAKPDIIAPTAPLFTKSETMEGKINLEWSNSISGDVARYALFRNTKPDTLALKLMEWPIADNRKGFDDTSVREGQQCWYQLTAYDSAGNEGTVRSRDIFFETGRRAPATSLKATIDKENKVIELQWKNPDKADRVIIYRKKNNEPFTIYETLEGNEESFKDKGRSIYMNNAYTYKVQPVFQNGARSVISKEVRVDF